MRIFTKECCDNLLKFVNNNDLRDNYFKGSFDTSKFNYLNIETKFNLPEDLILNPSPEKDLENSIKIYDALKDLDRVQANDKRLWLTLTHTLFFEYTKRRWDIRNADSDKKLIRRFYFEGSSLEARMRNSISRLWWSAKITYDESRDDHYELTKLLWSRQDIYQNIVERNYGTYDGVVTGLLEFYAVNKQLKEDQLRRLFTALNIVGGVKALPIQNKNEIKSTLTELAKYYGFTIAA
jgi:hypothetical protein